jgi:F-type H+-transporting ATPase subunit b
MLDLQADNQRILQARLERDMLKEALKWKENGCWCKKTKRKYKEQKIEQAKAAIESEKNGAVAELKAHTILSIAEKLLKKNYLTKSLKLN